MLEGLTPPKKESRCRVRKILAELEPADVQILLQALSDEEAWSHQALSDALKERGLEVSHSSIQRHRNGKCTHD